MPCVWCVSCSNWKEYSRSNGAQTHSGAKLRMWGICVCRVLFVAISFTHSFRYWHFFITLTLNAERWREMPLKWGRSARVTASVREQLKRFIGVIWQASGSPPAPALLPTYPLAIPFLPWSYLATCVTKSSNIKSWRCCGSCTTHSATRTSFRALESLSFTIFFRHRRFQVSSLSSALGENVYTHLGLLEINQ